MPLTDKKYQDTNYPVYRMVVSEEMDDENINQISLVEDNAIEVDFVYFSQDKEEIQFEFDEEEGCVTGPILIPEQKIYRTSPTPHYLTVDKNSIKIAVQKFFKQKKHTNFNLDHKKTKKADAFVYESWIIEDEKNDKAYNKGFRLPEGTAMMTAKIMDEETKEKIRNGKINGFSIEGMFDKKPIESSPQQFENNQKKSNKIMTLFDKLNKILDREVNAEKEYEGMPQEGDKTGDKDKEKEKEKMATTMRDSEGNEISFPSAALSESGVEVFDSEGNSIGVMKVEIKEKPSEEPSADQDAQDDTSQTVQDTEEVANSKEVAQAIEKFAKVQQEQNEKFNSKIQELYGEISRLKNQGGEPEKHSKAPRQDVELSGGSEEIDMEAIIKNVTQSN